jgi:tRNA nucleotidyltransferase (CCA-adding enzyme)
MAEILKKRTIENIEKIRDTSVKLGTGIIGMKKSEIYKLFEPLSQEAKLFIMARTKSEEIKKALSNYITYIDTFKTILTGEDLKKLGIKEGPLYREILDKLKEAKIDMNLKTKEEETNFIKNHLLEKGIEV